jgi:hypothetical protein
MAKSSATQHSVLRNGCRVIARRNRLANEPQKDVALIFENDAVMLSSFVKDRSDHLRVIAVSRKLGHGANRWIIVIGNQGAPRDCRNRASPLLCPQGAYASATSQDTPVAPSFFGKRGRSSFSGGAPEPRKSTETMVVGCSAMRTPFGQSGSLCGLKLVPSKRRCLAPGERRDGAQSHPPAPPRTSLLRQSSRCTSQVGIGA